MNYQKHHDLLIDLAKIRQLTWNMADLTDEQIMEAERVAYILRDEQDSQAADVIDLLLNAIRATSDRTITRD